MIDNSEWTILTAISSMGGRVSRKELFSYISGSNYLMSRLNLVNGDLEQLVSWKLSHLKSLGYVNNVSRGVWTITGWGIGEIEAKPVPLGRREKYKGNTAYKQEKKLSINRKTAINKNFKDIYNNTKLNKNSVFRESRNHQNHGRKSIQASMRNSKGSTGRYVFIKNRFVLAFIGSIFILASIGGNVDDIKTKGALFLVGIGLVRMCFKKG